MPVIKTNGINLYYEERGIGEPLLLIMGITAPGSVWEKHVSFWEKDFRCIMVDNRGIGFSDKPEGPYTTAQMADDYAGLLEALEIQKARVVGVSMGSTIAQQLAIRHPQTVHSLVLMCTWARCDNAAIGIFQHMINCKARFKPEEFTLFIQLLIYSKSSWANKAIVAEMEQGRKLAAVEQHPQPLHGLEGQAAACINHNVVDKLNRIQASTLVIGGREDNFTPVWMAEETAAGIPNAELHLFDECGHAFHWEKMEDFNPMVRDWLLKN
jgi:pimeloyl-ACP methyl ester carboxylesterase